jgi:hypothetical protein
MDFAPVCRDDRCKIDRVHAAHAVCGRERVFKHRSERPDPWRAPDAVGLRLAVFDSVDLRRAKPFREIKIDVLSSFGCVSGRSIQRALSDLMDERKVILVVHPEMGRVIGAHGAYIRMDSPLLWDPDGYPVLLEQLYDAGTGRVRD